MTMTKTLMIVAELAVINWALIVAASLIKAKAWKPSGLMAAMGNRETDQACSGFPARTEHLSLPAIEIGLDSTASARAEEVDAAFGAVRITGRRRNDVRRGPHRARRVGFPSGGRGPLQSGLRFAE